jgi:transcriptional regulator with XRE-family HTH domain
MTIGEFIKTRRDELNLSLADLAEILTKTGYAVERQTIGNWERGRNNPPIGSEHFRRALSIVLHIDESEILDKAGLTLTDDERSAEALRAASLIDQMSPEQRHLAIRLLETVLEN